MTHNTPDDPRVPLDSAGRPLKRTVDPHAGPISTEADMWRRGAAAARDPWLDDPASDPYVDDPYAYGDDLGLGPEDDPDRFYPGYHDEDDDDQGGYVSSAMDTVRRNPVGSALLIAGLALLAMPRVERDTVRTQTRRLEERVRGRYAGTESRLRGQAAQHRDKLGARAGKLGARAEELRDRISAGTEDMSEAARKRVIAARRRAIDMSDDAWQGLRSGTSDTGRMIRDNPLAAGALAVAAGAAIAAAIPGSRMESRRLGSVANRFWEEARAVFEEERARIVAGANAAMDEARSVATETVRDVKDAVPDGEDVVERTRDQAREAAKRVSDAAREGAKSEGSHPEGRTSEGRTSEGSGSGRT